MPHLEDEAMLWRRQHITKNKLPCWHQTVRFNSTSIVAKASAKKGRIQGRSKKKEEVKGDVKCDPLPPLA